jgi:LmbE family N-acetylglucosaminyl deacetylase/ActR/RegA family two-component response regulator
MLAAAPSETGVRPMNNLHILNSTPVAATLPRTGGRERVLVIEDDPNQARLIAFWVGLRPGTEVQVTASGKEGAELIAEGDWDLVISDINLPERDGLSLVAESKKACPHTPVLLMTAHERIDYAIQALKCRADDFIIKPVGREVLMDKVSELIETGERRKSIDRQIVLAVGAHPDDVEIGIGGLLARHRQRGDRVVILTLSGGERGGPGAERLLESNAAADVLGAELVIEDLPDTHISEGLDTITAIKAVIDRVQPTVVYTHTVHDAHQDHRNAFRATLVAARAVRNLFCYQSPSTTVDYKPTQFVSIEDTLERKLEALAAYRTQVTTRQYLTASLIRSTAEYWGRFAGYGLVEPLEVIRTSD